jgi:predicted site-specific integrase-resolvase
MSEERRNNMKARLARAIAQGSQVRQWARSHGVAERTAYRWARDPKVRTAVEAYRRRQVDRAVGRLAKRSPWAADAIKRLP